MSYSYNNSHLIMEGQNNLLTIEVGSRIMLVNFDIFLYHKQRSTNDDGILLWEKEKMMVSRMGASQSQTLIGNDVFYYVYWYMWLSFLHRNNITFFLCPPYMLCFLDLYSQSCVFLLVVCFDHRLFVWR